MSDCAKKPEVICRKDKKKLNSIELRTRVDTLYNILQKLKLDDNGWPKIRNFVLA